MVKNKNITVKDIEDMCANRTDYMGRKSKIICATYLENHIITAAVLTLYAKLELGIWGDLHDGNIQFNYENGNDHLTILGKVVEYEPIIISRQGIINNEPIDKQST
jgi:hypothetical protein